MKALGLLWIVVLIGNSQCSDDSENNEFNDTSSSFYTAAVVEFNAPGDRLVDPVQIVDANLAEYLALIYEAGDKGVDILVFSEASLNYNGINSLENLTEVAVELPSDVPSTSDCDYSNDVILRELSFAAANASIYVLVNVVEKKKCDELDEVCSSGVQLFNSNLVFDRNGCIVSRYRKFNLFVEPFMNVTQTPDISTFETDFGVTFGHFICFDILFKLPALDLIEMNVTHFLYPSMWYSETPFLTSIQIQQAFAQRHNIVLLSAGTNSPLGSNTGSGIFVGRHGAVDKIISWKNETRMIIAEVPIDVDDTDYEPGEPSVEPYTAEEMDELVLWTYKPLETFALQDHFEYEIENVKCEIFINFSRVSDLNENDSFGYRFTGFSGVRRYGGIANGGEVHCAIVPCANDNDGATCGNKLSGKKIPTIKFHSVRVKMTITGDDESYSIMPTSLDTSILPLSTKMYSFEIDGDEDKVYSMHLKDELDNLMTFGLYGRNFNLDSRDIQEHYDEATTTESDETSIPCNNTDDEDDEDKNYKTKMMIYVTIMIVLSILCTIMTYRKLQTPYLKPDYNKRKSCSN